MKRKNVRVRYYLADEEQRRALEEQQESGPASILWMLFSALIGMSLWAGILWVVFHFVL